MNNTKITLDEIEFVVKPGTRSGRQVWNCTLWVRGKKEETKISYSVPCWATRETEPPTKEWVFGEILEKSRYAIYSYESWCAHHHLNSYDRRELSIYNHSQAVAKKLRKLNGGEYFQYTLVGLIGKWGGIGYEWVADDDWGRIEKDSSNFRVLRLKKQSTDNLSDRLLRVVRNRYPDLYKRIDYERKVFDNQKFYEHFIAYFYPDGRWGIENCESKRIWYLQKRGVAKIYFCKKIWQSRSIKMSIYVGNDKCIPKIEYLLFKAMRRHGIEPIE